PPRAPHSFPTRRSSDLTRATVSRWNSVLGMSDGLHVLEGLTAGFAAEQRLARGRAERRGPCGIRRAAARAGDRLAPREGQRDRRSEEHTSELQSPYDLV